MPPTADLILGADGFTSDAPVPVSAGRFVWNVLAEYLADNATATPARIFLAEPSETNITTRGNRIAGPAFEIIRADANDNNNVNNNNMTSSAIGNSDAGANPIAIALPVTLGVLMLCFLGFCVWFKRRQPDFGRGLFALFDRCGARRERGGGMGMAENGVGAVEGKGYGVGRGRSQRLRGQDIKVINTDLQGLRMNAMAMYGDQDRNVFREEMRRQERVRF